MNASDPGVRYVVVTLPELVLFLVVVSVVLGIAASNTWDAYKTWRRMQRSGLNGGFIILAWTHVWGAASRANMANLLLLAGLLCFFEEVWMIYWPVLLMAVSLGYTTVRSRIDRDRAGEIELEKQEQERLAAARASGAEAARS